MVTSVEAGDLFDPEHDTLKAEEALRAAEMYLSLGWAVTAGPGLDSLGVCACKLGKKCRNPGKHAYGGWGNDTRRTMTLDQVRRYWGPGNSRWKDHPVDQVFIVPYLSGLIVADVDNEIAWGQVDPVDRPETLKQRSGSGRGGHWLYRFDWDLSLDIPPVVPGRLKLSAGEVKFRGIIAGAPSMHAQGGRYAWENWGTEIADAPDWMITKPARDSVEYDWDAVVNADPSNVWIDLQFAADCGGMENAGEARTGRPVVLFAVAASMAKWIAAGRITTEQVVEQLLAAAERNGALDQYGSTDIERQIRNGIETGFAEKR